MEGLFQLLGTCVYHTESAPATKHGITYSGLKPTKLTDRTHITSKVYIILTYDIYNQYLFYIILYDYPTENSNQ